jgi:flagellar hook-basal body complex protein FliE
MPIDPITTVNRIGPLTGPGGVDKTNPAATTPDDFGQMLSNALDRLNQMEGTANNAATSLAAGEDIDIHQVMLTMQEADISFQLALQVRNKLVEAYQEVMRMQV